MALNREQMEMLLKMLEGTRDVELSCPECLDHLDKYIQRILDGEPIDGVLEQVKTHLEACPPCNDQFKLVIETLKAIDDE